MEISPLLPGGAKRSLKFAAVVVLAAALAAACATLRPAAPADPLRSILLSHTGLRQVVRAAPRFRFQAVLGLVEERPGGRPVLVTHGFRLGAEYFYPASAVKLFAAVAALERLAELRRETGLSSGDLGVDTPLVFHPLFAGEKLEGGDPSNLEGSWMTVRHEIRKLFLV